MNLSELYQSYIANFNYTFHIDLRMNHTVLKSFKIKMHVQRGSQNPINFKQILQTIWKSIHIVKCLSDFSIHAMDITVLQLTCYTFHPECDGDIYQAEN